ncbi:MAG: NAD-dependent succinate-semialdehyde dehydrogenase [Clostridia bacterium]|nr:NAD-dependent succinate-semialdehyde dehydrogenase [Clostridia bacterium]
MKHLLYYNGNWLESDGNDSISVLNPANGEILDQITYATATDMEKIIMSADKGFEIWSNLTAEERCDYLERLYDLVMAEKEDLARILTKENGKPYPEALGEIYYGASFLKWYSEEGKRINGEIIPASQVNKRILVRKQPVGIVYGITPWNFPFAMITRKLAPALAAGCSFIVKPSEETPLTAIKFFELVHRVGFPPGVVNCVTADAKKITEVVMNSSKVRKITFTGSTQVGKLLMKQAADTVKQISLELGGHAPFIVFEDADIDKAVEGTIASKFRNCGQVCIATNRVLVHEKVKDIYLRKLTEAVLKLKIGDGFEDQVKLGPIINHKGFEKIMDHIEDAKAKGGNIVVGGRRIDSNPSSYFIEPTIIDRVTEEMKMLQEETFGPVIPIITFKSDEEAINIANNTPYGLAAYFFTESVSRGFRVSEKLDYGIVGFNTGSPSTAQAPFGGFKESGLGREGGHFGIEEFLETKYVCLEI